MVTGPWSLSAQCRGLLSTPSSMFSAMSPCVKKQQELFVGMFIFILFVLNFDHGVIGVSRPSISLNCYNPNKSIFSLVFLVF